MPAINSIAPSTNTYPLAVVRHAHEHSMATVSGVCRRSTSVETMSSTVTSTMPASMSTVGSSTTMTVTLGRGPHSRARCCEAQEHDEHTARSGFTRL
jgi:hypothetical protein